MSSGRLLATELASPIIDRMVNPASEGVWWLLRRFIRW